MEALKKNEFLFLLVIFSMALMQSIYSQINPLKNSEEIKTSSGFKIFLCGDVMTGRGIDQVLPVSVNPVLYEQFVKDARVYLFLAEEENGEILEPVSYEYIWGDALKVWKEEKPQLKLINLETSITTRDEPWPRKGIHYRMHPENIKVINAAGIDYCGLANNHILDWGREGLTETMKSLRSAGIRFSGVGKDLETAQAPAIFSSDNGRVLVFAFGHESSGVFYSWAAEEEVSGVNLLPEMSAEAIKKIKALISDYNEPGDIVVLSIHWGGNWGYEIPDEQRKFAKELIDEAGVDLIYGHSSHHPKGLEVYKEKLIIYGAGDFINDYEGISGHEQYRGELAIMYFPVLKPITGELQSLKMVPMKVRNFRLNKASSQDAEWLKEMFNREGKSMNSSVHRDNRNNLLLKWN